MTGIPVRVGVVGGGRMGAGIAQVFATLGSMVTIVETADRQAALDRVVTGLRRADERGKLDGREVDEVAGRVSAVAAVHDLATDTDLVVEAVPEVPVLKVDVLTAVEDSVGARTVIASNTSSISIAELGAALTDPRRFIGMHFFNPPVPASSLVEIVRARRPRLLSWTWSAGGCPCSGNPRSW